MGRNAHRYVRVQRNFLIQRDGNECYMPDCKEVGTDEKPLEVDHIDGNYENDDPANLRLLCHKCNCREWHRRRNMRLEARASAVGVKSSNGVAQQPPENLQKSPQNESVCGEEYEKSLKTPISSSFFRSVSKKNVSICANKEEETRVDEESVEIRINREKEPLYRSLALEMAAERKLTTRRAIYGLAEKLGISPATTRRYLEKMLSEEGPLALTDRGPRGDREITVREGFE